MALSFWKFGANSQKYLKFYYLLIMTYVSGLDLKLTQFYLTFEYVEMTC